MKKFVKNMDNVDISVFIKEIIQSIQQLAQKKKKKDEDNVNFSGGKLEKVEYTKLVNNIIEEYKKKEDQTTKINKVKKDKDYLKSFLDIDIG
jgi:uncharacterized protein YgfB (UPF0149 family)